LIALSMILVARVISAHATDAILDFRLSGFSVGRLLDMASICLVAHGATLRLRQL
jgi:hypothetical protein